MSKAIDIIKRKITKPIILPKQNLFVKIFYKINIYWILVLILIIIAIILGWGYVEAKDIWQSIKDSAANAQSLNDSHDWK